LDVLPFNPLPANSVNQTGSNPVSSSIPTPPDLPQSTASDRPRHSTISRRSHSHTTERDRRVATLESVLHQNKRARDRLVRDGDYLDLQVRQLRCDIQAMEVLQRGLQDEITRLETEISTLAHDAGNDHDSLRAQVLQLRTERNDFERHTISARQDLHHTEADRNRLRQEATQAGDEIWDLQEQVSVLERATDDARSESTTALASYNRISSRLTQPQPDHGGESVLGGSTRQALADRDRGLADLALARATLM
ncbi:Lipid binding protein, partial [Phytophthora megakarya]